MSGLQGKKQVMCPSKKVEHKTFGVKDDSPFLILIRDAPLQFLELRRCFEMVCKIIIVCFPVDYLFV